MKKIVIFTFMLLFLSPLGWAEGIWQVNGRIFSNVNVLQRGNQITVSGRVSSGQATPLLVSRFLVTNSDHERYHATAAIEHYKGQGETFSATVYVAKRGRNWKVISIESN